MYAKSTLERRLVLAGFALAGVMLASRVAVSQPPDAHEFTHQMVDGEKVSKPWREVVGKRVKAEGLAWGAFEKGLGQRVILDGAAVYIRGVDFLKQELNGKPVRVEGVLRVGKVKAASPGAAGFGEDVSYYYIAADRAEAIDRAKTPWLQEVLRATK